jgi:tetratricopeptide (TPR) repeat protein
VTQWRADSMTQLMTLEQKVECLREEVGELRDHFRTFIGITKIKLSQALVQARQIAEYVVNSVIEREGFEKKGILLQDIDTLGGTSGNDKEQKKLEQRRNGQPPVLPKQIYSALHCLRIYGNSIVHPDKAENVEVTSTDIQAALAQLLRLVEWYFEEYAKGPRKSPIYSGQPESILGRYSDTPPDVAGFLDREQELQSIEAMLTDGPTRALSIVGTGGTGKSALTACAAQRLVTAGRVALQQVLWFDLSGNPTFGDVTARAIASLDPAWRPGDSALVSMAPATRVSLLVRFMTQTSVLLVLDNLETLLDTETGHARDPETRQLLETLAAASHMSRVLATSRLEPRDLVSVAGRSEILMLSGLSEPSFARLMRSQGVNGADSTVSQAWAELDGNPRLLLFLTDLVRRRYRGDLDQAMRRQSQLLAKAAGPLLSEIWEELPAPAQQALQTLSILDQPVFEEDYAGVFARLFPASDSNSDDVVWDQLVPRNLVVNCEEPPGFRLQHPLITEFSVRQWADATAAHQTAAKFYLERAGVTPRPEEEDCCEGDLRLNDQQQHDLVTAVRHALAAKDRRLAQDILLGTRLLKELQRVGNSLRIAGLLRNYLDTIGNGQTHRTDGPAMRVRRILGATLRDMGERQNPTEMHEDCLRMARERGDDTEACRVLTELCRDHRVGLRLPDSLECGRQALEVARSRSLRREQAEILLELALAERASGRQRESAQLAREAMAIGTEVDDAAIVAMAHTALGTLLRASNTAQARSHFESSLTIAREEGNRYWEGRLLGSLADLARRDGNLVEAIRLANQAIQRRQEIGDRTGEAIDRACLALALLDQGELTEALRHLRASLRVQIELQHWRAVSARLVNLGRVFEVRDRFAVAVACYQLGLQVHEAWGLHIKKWKAYLSEMRETAEGKGVAWSTVVQEAAQHRDKLLAEATGIPAQQWPGILDEMLNREKPNS